MSLSVTAAKARVLSLLHHASIVMKDIEPVTSQGNARNEPSATHEVLDKSVDGDRKAGDLYPSVGFKDA
ncbi:MAG: hypothetical protein Q9211_002186 [Gyalolechia sp. 1 TL-2023]